MQHAEKHEVRHDPSGSRKFCHSLDLHSDWSKKTQATRDDVIALISQTSQVAMRDNGLSAVAVLTG